MKTKNNLLILVLIGLLASLILNPAAAFAQESDPTPNPSSISANRLFVPFIGRPASTGNPTVPQSEPFRFISWGDTKTNTSVLASLSKQAKPLSPAFTLYMGDLQNYGFDASTIGTWKNALNGNSSNGTFDITFPIRGNHDYKDLPGWQSYFDLAGNAKRIGAVNYTELVKDTTYAFDYKNAVFISLDVLGNAELASDSVITFLDTQLTAAEKRGMTHAFVTMHGPIYPVANHNECERRVCATPAAVGKLVNVLNKHPIVSAVFHGHEHIFSYVHMDSTRIPEITNPWEQFITGAAGAGPNLCDQPFRFDYCGSYHGFATVDVSGKTFTVKIYQQGTTNAVKTYTFTKE